MSNGILKNDCVLNGCNLLDFSDNLKVTSMCSVVDLMEVREVPKARPRTFACRNCGNTFKGVGFIVECPECGSDNVYLY